MSGPDMRLTSTRWNLGICMPGVILGHNGHLQRRQLTIRSIQLSLDPSCLYPNQCPFSLSDFRHLKRLSWRGSDGGVNLEELVHGLQASMDQLEEVELDLCQRNWAGFMLEIRETHWGKLCATMFAILIGATSDYKLPLLRKLSLAYFPLLLRRAEVATSLSFSWLQSLALRHCPGWCQFLSSIGETCQPIKLKTLEVASNSIGEDSLVGYEVMSRFLEAFNGLETLYLSIYGVNTSELWKSTAYHKSTLRKWVYQEIDPCNLESRDGFQYYSIRVHLDLEFIGICSTADTLVSDDIGITSWRRLIV